MATKTTPNRKRAAAKKAPAKTTAKVDSIKVDGDKLIEQLEKVGKTKEAAEIRAMAKPKAERKPRAAAKPKAPAKTAEPLIADPKATLIAYLKAEASETEVGTVEYPKPYVTANGRVYVHSRAMTKWAKANVSRKVEKRDVQKALSSLGLKVRTGSLPGHDKSVGFYTAVKPVPLAGVKVRDRRTKPPVEPTESPEFRAELAKADLSGKPAVIDGSDEHDAAVKSGA